MARLQPAVRSWQAGGFGGSRACEAACLQLGASRAPQRSSPVPPQVGTARGWGWVGHSARLRGGSALMASEKQGRSWRGFTCVYFLGALFLDLSYFGLQF